MDTDLLPTPMTNRRGAPWLGVLCLIAIALAPIEGYTANRQETPLDAVVLMDDSGSMRKTDPLKLRFSALALFIQLLRNDDAVGIVQFDDNATVRAALRLLQSEKDRSALESVVTQFSSRGAYTNIYGGLQTALREMQQHSREGPDKAVILISDGLMDINPASGLGHGETLRALHDQLLPEYRTARIKIVTLALSEEADRTLLQDIAIATGGQFFYAPRSEALSQALFSIFDGLKSPDLVPADGPQVLIDSSVKEATFFILSDSAKEDVALIRPDGNRVNRKRRDPSVKWHMGKDYVLVTIQEPLAGEWHVETTHQRPIRVAVITDMRLEVAANHESYFIDQQAHISARLVGDGELGMVSLSLAELIYTAEVTPPGLPTGMRLPLFRSGDSGLANTPSEPATLAMGQWVSTIYSPLPVPGEYQGRVVAWAPTFSREKSFFFRVLPTPAQSMPVTSPPSHLSTSEGAVPKGHLAVAETPAPVTPLGTASPADILQPTTEVETASLAPWVHVIQQWAFAHLILLTLAGLALVGYRVATGAWWIKRKTPDTETLEI